MQLYTFICPLTAIIYETAKFPLLSSTIHMFELTRGVVDQDTTLRIYPPIHTLYITAGAGTFTAANVDYKSLVPLGPLAETGKHLN